MAAKRVIVYGGKGSLGSICVSAFKAQKWVCTIRAFMYQFTLPEFILKLFVIVGRQYSGYL